MKNILRKDSLLTIGMVALLAAGYYFGIFRPSAKKASLIRRGISAAEQSVGEIPRRVAELESLKREIEHRDSFLREQQKLIPSAADLHAIVEEVTRLANLAGLKVVRLEPMPTVTHASYEKLSFQASLNGNFQGLSQFLYGLETGPRLIVVNDLSVGPENDRTERSEKIELQFSVYVFRGEKPEFVNNADSSAVPRADANIR